MLPNYLDFMINNRFKPNKSPLTNLKKLFLKSKIDYLNYKKLGIKDNSFRKKKRQVLQFTDINDEYVKCSKGKIKKLKDKQPTMCRKKSQIDLQNFSE